jgi:hypothetical protein
MPCSDGKVGVVMSVVSNAAAILPREFLALKYKIIVSRSDVESSRLQVKMSVDVTQDIFKFIG